MKKIILTFTILCTAFALNAQVKVGNNPTSINANSVLEMESTNKGMLLPRVELDSTLLATPLTAHIAGMTIYNTKTINDVTPGCYYNDGAKWVRIEVAKKLNLGVFQNVRKTTLTADTIAANDYTIIFRSSANSTLSLPDPTTCKGRILVIVNNSSFTITFDKNIYRDAIYATAGNGTTFGYVNTLGTAGVIIGSVNIGNKMTLQSSGDEWTLTGI